MVRVVLARRMPERGRAEAEGSSAMGAGGMGASSPLSAAASPWLWPPLPQQLDSQHVLQLLQLLQLEPQPRWQRKMPNRSKQGLRQQLLQLLQGSQQVLQGSQQLGPGSQQVLQGSQQLGPGSQQVLQGSQQLLQPWPWPRCTPSMRSNSSKLEAWLQTPRLSTSVPITRFHFI